jgi:hypothetical protein
MNKIEETQLKLEQLRGQYQRITERRLRNTGMTLERGLDIDTALEVLRTAITACELALEFYMDMSNSDELTSVEVKQEVEEAICIAISTRNNYPHIETDLIAQLACARFQGREDYKTILFRVKMKLMN